MASGLKDGAAARVRVRTPGKLITAFLFVPVIVIAIGAGVWLNAVGEQHYRAALEYRKSESGQRKAYYTLPEIVVDLQPDQNGVSTFLKTRITIALDSDRADDVARRLDANKPAILERVSLFMRQLQPDDLRGAEAMARVKTETARRINLVVGSPLIGDVLFEEFVIQ